MGAKQFIALRADELPMPNETMYTVNSEIGGSSFRSVCFLSHGPSGILYQTRESVIIRQDDEECILLQVTNFLSITKDNVHNNFVRGRVYTVVNETEAIGRSNRSIYR